MSLLDQLFPDTQESENQFTTALTPEQRVIIQATEAAHQAMIDGFQVASDKIDTSLPSPKYNVSGTINVADTIRISNDYKSLLIQDQMTDPRRSPTADDVIDGGIKNGSKIILQLIGDGGKSLQSWDKLMKSRIAETTETFTPASFYFDKFSVMSLQEVDNERYQIHETFGADIIQAFGRRPRMVTLAGQIVNGKVNVQSGAQTFSMDWKNAFERYYERHFSVTACLRKRKKVRIFAQDTIWEGYLLSLTSATDAENQGISQVSVQFIVAKKFYANQDDLKIPGTRLPNSNFTVPGRTVPKEIFPASRPELYLRESLAQQITSLISVKRSERDALIKKLADEDPGLTEIDIKENLESLSGDADDQYFWTAEGIKLHNLSTSPSALANAIADYFTDLKKQDADRIEFNNDLGYPLVGQELIEPPAGSNRDRYEILKASEARLRMRRRSINAAVINRNLLCEKIYKLQLEINQYVKTLPS